MVKCLGSYAVATYAWLGEYASIELDWFDHTYVATTYEPKHLTIYAQKTM